jgi:cell division protein FtsL
MEIKSKRILTYFAVTLLALAVCVQVVTAPAAPTNAQLQTEIATLQTQNSNQQSQIDNLNTQAANLALAKNGLQDEATHSRLLEITLNNDLIGLQQRVSAIKQVAAASGYVKDGDTIKVPVDPNNPNIIYTTDDCNILFGFIKMPVTAVHPESSSVTFDQKWVSGTTYISPLDAGYTISAIPSSDKKYFTVHIRFIEMFPDSTIGSYPRGLNYMLVATK